MINDEDLIISYNLSDNELNPISSTLIKSTSFSVNKNRSNELTD